MTIILDGSLGRVSDFEAAIVRYAIDNAGFHLDHGGMDVLLRAEADAYELVSDLSCGDAECLHWIAEEAIEHLNAGTGCWYVEDSALWCSHGYACAECGESEATTYVVTILDPTDPNSQTEVCLDCHNKLAEGV